MYSKTLICHGVEWRFEEIKVVKEVSKLQISEDGNQHLQFNDGTTFDIPLGSIFSCTKNGNVKWQINFKNMSCSTFEMKEGGALEWQEEGKATVKGEGEVMEIWVDLMSWHLESCQSVNGESALLKRDGREWSMVEWEGRVYPCPPSITAKDLEEWSSCRSKPFTLVWEWERKTLFKNALFLTTSQPNGDHQVDLKFIKLWFDFAFGQQQWIMKKGGRQFRMVNYEPVDTGPYDPYMRVVKDTSTPTNIQLTSSILWEYCCNPIDPTDLKVRKNNQLTESMEVISKHISALSWTACSPLVKKIHNELSKGEVVLFHYGLKKGDEGIGNIFVALVLLLADRQYRTTSGFCSLFFSYFSSKGKYNCIPSFCFLSCTFELCRRYSTVFEFNDKMIYLLLESSYPYLEKENGAELFLQTLEEMGTDTYKNCYYVSCAHFDCFSQEDESSVLYSFLLRHNTTHNTIMKEFLDNVAASPEDVRNGVQCFSYFISDYSPFSRLTKIQLINGNLTSITHSICELTEVEELYLDNNLIDYISYSISSLSKLQVLSISSNKLSFLPNLNLPKLKKVNLDKNTLFSLDSLSGCISLEEISATQNNIEQLQHNLANLKSLVRLNLPGNKINYISDTFLAGQNNLRFINLSSNNLAHFPTSLGNIPNLTTLDLSSNRLSSIPSNVFQNSINRLDLSTNKLTSLPLSIGNLSTLTSLKLNYNSLEIIPITIKKYSLLEELEMEGNKLTEIPFWISGLCNLEYLNFKRNVISLITLTIGQLWKLKSLDLEGNMLKTVPCALASLNNLVHLSLRINPIDNDLIPQSVLPHETQSLEPLFETLRKNAQYPKKKFKIKMMVLGNDGSGKSTLISSLSSKCRVLPNETSNYECGEGIRITNLLAESKKKKEVTFEIWDFEGSSTKAYYATHQFFLTPLCIYMIVFRADDESMGNLEYWLQSIATYIPRAKIVLVATHATPQVMASVQFNIKVLKEKLKSPYPYIEFIKEMFLGLEDGSVDQLKKYLIHFITKEMTEGKRLNGVLNSPSFQLFERVIKEYKANISIPVVSFEDITKICNQCRIDKVQEALTDFHKMGVLIYFEKSKELREIVILDPQWLFGEMATLFREGDNEEYGIVPMNQLSFTSKSDIVAKKLLTLIEKFQVAFPLRDKEQFSFLMDKMYLEPTKKFGPFQYLFVPALVRKMERPELIEQCFSFEQKSKHTYIHRSFNFSFIPIGLFPRFITVVLHLMSPTVLALWDKGFIFEIVENTKWVKLLVQNNFYDLGEEAYNENDEESDYQIKLELISNDCPLCCDTFCSILDIMLTTGEDWKKQNCTMYWQSYLDQEEPYSIKTIQRLYENDIVVVDLPPDLNFDTVIPEIAFPSFKGKRYNKRDIKSGKKLGSGAYSQVYIGTIGTKDVAVKELLLSEDPADMMQIRCRFNFEISIQSQLHHPNIVAIEGICCNPLSMLFELCPEGDLLQFIEDYQNQISWKLRSKILMELASAIQYLHTLPVPVIHRDLKSMNVLMFSTNENDPLIIKVADFGTAIKFLRPISSRVVDNPTWLAPEILEGSEYDLSVDIYAFGMICYETFAREQPFLTRWSETEVMVLSGRRPTIPPECPEFFSHLMQACWAQVPSSRPSWNHIITELSKVTTMSPEEYHEMEKLNTSYLFSKWCSKKEKEAPSGPAVLKDSFDLMIGQSIGKNLITSQIPETDQAEASVDSTTSSDLSPKSNEDKISFAEFLREDPPPRESKSPSTKKKRDNLLRRKSEYDKVTKEKGSKLSFFGMKPKFSNRRKEKKKSASSKSQPSLI